MARRMINKKLNKIGITVVEIVIVAALSCVILGVAMAMMSRSNTQFKKSNELISIQRLMDNIIERIRSDVRSLKRIIPSENSEEGNSNEVSFIIVKYASDNNEADQKNVKHLYNKISYRFDPEENTLYRQEWEDCDENGEQEGSGSEVKSDFHGARQVISLNFEPVFKDEEKKDFNCLNVAMQITSNANDSKATTLSIACQFYSTCVESELRISKLRGQN